MQTAISAIFVFLVVIWIHELGHFTVAKLVGIKVNEFAIGMGPKLIQGRKGETKYTLRALPIGGYVSMEGEDEGSEDPRSFGKASPLARMGVIAAGAFMNFLLAVIVLSIVAFYYGEPTTVVEETLPDSPAKIAGIMPGDNIIKINDTKIDNWDELAENINSSGDNQEISVFFIRNNKEEKIKMRTVKNEDGYNVIGIRPSTNRSIAYSLKFGFLQTGMVIKVMFQFVAMIFKGQVSFEHLAGPVGVINEVGKASERGIGELLMLLAFININLGFFNLLPIPALDGSRLLFIFIELIRGKPMDPDKEGFVHMIGFILLLSLMFIVTYKDLAKLSIFRRIGDLWKQLTGI